MKNILPLLLGVLTFSVQGQSYEELISEGENHYAKEEYLESAHAYDNAFEIEEGDALDYYNAACSWALTGDTIHSLEYADLSAEKGWLRLDHIKRDTDLENLHSVQGWEEVLRKVQSNIDEYNKQFNQPLKNQLERIYLQDQTLRQLYLEAENKFGRGTQEMNYFWEVVAEKDSLNEIELTEILNEHGWPGISEVGGKANFAAFLVIQHAPLETQEKFLPLLQESVRKGESQGKDLALLEDRIQMRKDLPQTYGSQFYTDQETGKNFFYEIKEPEYVNQRRREVGLPPLENYAKSMGIEWSVKQKEK